MVTVDEYKNDWSTLALVRNGIWSSLDKMVELNIIPKDCNLAWTEPDTSSGKVAFVFCPENECECDYEQFVLEVDQKITNEFKVEGFIVKGMFDNFKPEGGYTKRITLRTIDYSSSELSKLLSESINLNMQTAKERKLSPYSTIVYLVPNADGNTYPCQKSCNKLLK